MYVFSSIKICYFLTAPMSCIINTAHAKRHTMNLRHVGAIHETTYVKLGENFLRKVIRRHATLKRRESKGKPANVSRYERHGAMQQHCLSRDRFRCVINN